MLEEIEIVKPADIEKRSMEIITSELGGRTWPEPEFSIVKRCIHTAADFDYADHLKFSENVVEKAREAIKKGAVIITDTKMGWSGVNKKRLESYGGEALCFMADEDVACEAAKREVTRAAISVEKAAERNAGCIMVVGNAPTALMRIRELYDAGKFCPSLVIGVPVGFVNVVEAKEDIINSSMPYIVARGRKGGSNVAAAVMNALFYMAADDDKEWRRC